MEQIFNKYLSEQELQVININPQKEEILEIRIYPGKVLATPSPLKLPTNKIIAKKDKENGKITTYLFVQHFSFYRYMGKDFAANENEYLSQVKDEIEFINQEFIDFSEAKVIRKEGEKMILKENEELAEKLRFN